MKKKDSINQSIKYLEDIKKQFSNFRMSLKWNEKQNKVGIFVLDINEITKK
jgi:hypothetical protein